MSLHLKWKLIEGEEVSGFEGESCGVGNDVGEGGNAIGGEGGGEGFSCEGEGKTRVQRFNSGAEESFELISLNRTFKEITGDIPKGDRVY